MFCFPLLSGRAYGIKIWLKKDIQFFISRIYDTIFKSVFSLQFNVWNNSRRLAFANQIYKTSGYFSLDFDENIQTKLVFYLD